MVLHDDDLDKETKKRIGLKESRTETLVEKRLVALGKVLESLSGLTNREALWVLRNAIYHISGHRRRTEKQAKVI